MKKITFWSVLLLLSATTASAVWQKVVIHSPVLPEVQQHLATGELELMRRRPDGLECLADGRVVDLLIAGGFEITVLVADLDKHYRALLKGAKLSFGNYYTYAEMKTELNSLHGLYPSLTSAPESIGVSREGRGIWAIKVSSSPNAGNGKPGMIFNGVHHAREPIGCSMCLGLVRHLCANYGTDTLVTWLVNNRQFWFIPVLNPDGYVFNETDASGAWRKNRRNNSGSYGVDINRNYPYMWGYDDLGSTGTPSDETYRGPSAGSEPEIQALMGFGASKGCIAMDINYHSYGDLWMYPWGYTTTPTPDSALFGDLARECIVYNGYTWGQSAVVNYYTNGDAKDWWYGETGVKPKCFNFTVEIGDDFWQAVSDSSIIVSQFNANLTPNKLSAEAAGVYLAVTGNQVVGGAVPHPGDTVQATVSLKNKAMRDTAKGIWGRLTTADPYVSLLQDSAYYADFTPRQSRDNSAAPFRFAVSSSCPSIHTVPFRLHIRGNNSYASSDTFSIIIGAGSAKFQPTPDNVPTYYAVEDSDAVARAPVYSWYEIRSLGTQLAALATDDATVRVKIPFNFKWYGTAYDSVSVCTNGWLSFGRNTSTAYGNTTIPSSTFANPTIFAQWDDLTGSSTYGAWIGYYYDSANKRFIVEWDSVANVSSTGTRHKFQVILYDSTGTGTKASKYYDAVVQYQMLTPGTSSSIGFQNSGTIGGQELYNGTYASTMLTLGPNRAVRLTGQPTGALAVAMSNFSAQAGPAGVDVFWRTESEYECYKWQVERSQLPQAGYQEVALVDGHGTTAQPSDYCYTDASPLSPGAYYYRITEIDRAGRRNSYGPMFVQVEGRGLPLEYELGQCHPNPSHGQLSISFALQKPGMTTLTIYNIMGQAVRRLEHGELPAGRHTRSWDGTDMQGKAVAGGIYFYRLSSGSFTDTRKMTVLK